MFEICVRTSSRQKTTVTVDLHSWLKYAKQLCESKILNWNYNYIMHGGGARYHIQHSNAWLHAVTAYTMHYSAGHAYTMHYSGSDCLHYAL